MATALLATALLVAVAGIMSGVGWAIRDRALQQAAVEREEVERQERIALQVELLLSDVDRLTQEQRWDDALTAAKRAEVAIAVDNAEEEVSEEVRAVLQELEFVARLSEIRMERATIVENTFDDAGAAENYAQAFRDFGVDLDALAADDAVARLKKHLRIALPVAEALDEFVYVRRRAAKSGGRTADSTVLIETARRLDQHPLRNQLRTTWDRNLTPEHQAALRKLVESFDVRMQSPLTAERLADTLKDAKLPDLAEQVLRDAQQHCPGDFWLNLRLGNVLLNQNERIEAVRFYTAALGIKPHSPAAQTNLGAALCPQGRLDEGIACFRKAIELNPNYPKPYLNLGSALYEQGKMEEAIACYHKAIELDPKFAPAHYFVGVVLNRQGKSDDAISCYRKAIELDPKYAEAHYNLGVALCNQEKLDDAIHYYHKAIELDPKLALAHYNLGLVLAKQAKLDEAISCWRHVIEIDPKYADAHFNLGLALAVQGKLNDAIHYYHKAIEIDPKYASAHNNLGDTLVKQDKLDDAIACYRKAIELDPNYAHAHYNLGVGLKKQGKLDEAIARFRKVIELDPNSAVAHAQLGSLLKDHGSMKEAMGSLRKAVELDPTLWWGVNNLAHCLATADDVKVRNPQEALALAQRAVRINPDNADCWDVLSVAAYRAGDWKTSLNARQEKLRRAQLTLNDRLFLAMIHWRLEEKLEAHKWFDEAMARIRTEGATGHSLEELRKEAEQLLGSDGALGKPIGASALPESPPSAAAHQ